MQGWLELVAFAGVMAVGQFSPGPDMLLLTRTSLAEGVGNGIRMALGIATGLAAHAALAIGGSSWLFQRDGWLRTGLEWVAAGYLLWLAWGLFRSSTAETGAVDGADVPSRREYSPFLRGLWCNLLNPKVLVFLAAVTAPFMSGERPSWWPVALGGIVVVQGWLLWSLWAGLLQWPPIRGGYQRAGRWIDAAFGLGLAVLAMGLLIAS